MMEPLVVHGRYRLEEVLRRAAAVTTYGGIDEQTGAAVVVKELRVSDLGAWKEFDLFQREVETLAAVRHASIPKVLDHFHLQSDGGARVYIVMARAPGESLDRRIERGAPLEPSEVRRILVGVLEVLDHLHHLAPPLIHRDVKPGNIVVGPERVYLVDFGGVRRFLPWAKGGSTVVGTFGYMAPEQLHGDAQPATDLYGLGATLAALLAGCDASDLPRQGLRIDIRQIPAAREPFRAILERLLEPDPEDRFGSAAEVLEALERPQLPIPRSAGGSALAPRGAAPLQPAVSSSHWVIRTSIRWTLLGLGGFCLLGAFVAEGLRFFSWLPLVGDLAMVMGQLGIGFTIGGLLVRTKGTYRRKILRLARKRGGRLHLADVCHRLRMAPERALEILEEMVSKGLARHDPEDAGAYLVSVSR